jgi:hypothetical protein
VLTASFYKLKPNEADHVARMGRWEIHKKFSRKTQMEVTALEN